LPTLSELNDIDTIQAWIIIIWLMLLQLGVAVSIQFDGCVCCLVLLKCVFACRLQLGSRCQLTVLRCWAHSSLLLLTAVNCQPS